jgi:glycosyltransferase involved in cell wall biosynthesis
VATGADRVTRVLVSPRDPNPYQALLYKEVTRHGFEVRYLEGPTRSHTVNVLLTPVTLLVARLRGTRLLHLHWVFGFALPAVRERRGLRSFDRLWFGLCLRWARLLRIRIVWTAHNAMPHAPVFDDDRAARRTLIRACDAVIAHSEHGLAALAESGLPAPRRAYIIPHPSYSGYYPDTVTREEARARLGLKAEEFVFLALGQIAAYKGTDDLLTVFLESAERTPGGLLIAGSCRDEKLRERVESAVDTSGGAIRADFGSVPDHGIQDYFRAADIGVLPFRKVTTSGSALLALSFGIPLLLPDLPAFADIPDDVCLRYPAGIDGLRSAIWQVSTLSSAELGRIGAEAARFAAGRTWASAAELTAQCYRLLLAEG